MQGNKKKWDEYFDKFKVEWHRKIFFELEADLIRKLLKPMKSGLMIDIGCGLPYVDIFLAKKTEFKIIANDLVDSVLKGADQLIKEHNLSSRIKTEKGDGFRLPYKDNTFDVAISTGSSSAGSFPGVPDEMKRIVKKNGYLVFDYKRPYNIYALLDGSLRLSWKKYKCGENYHFGRLGIKNYIEKKLGLKIEAVKPIFTFPPLIKNRLLNIVFERSVGRVCGLFLARTLMIKVKNTK